MDTAFEGSSRRRLEGGLWNDSVLKFQNGAGYMLPGLVAGGVTTLGVRQFASPALAARFAAGRLGVSGFTNGIAAAGQSYLRTENLIRAAEAAGDTERAQSIRRFQDLHALLTAGLSMTTERFSPLQKLAPGSGGAGLRGGLAGMVKEAAENPLNNMVQGTVIDPLIGEHPDVVGEAPSDFLSGLMTAGGMKGMQAGVRLPERRRARAEGLRTEQEDFIKKAGPGSEVDSEEERRVRDGFLERVAANVPAAVDAYIKRFGKVVDTDKARELEPAYAESRESRQQHSRGTSHTANLLAKRVYETLLAREKPGTVLFNAGGPGSGKSSTLSPADLRNHAIIYDTVMSDAKRGIEQIDRALKAGHRVTIRYIHQPLDDAVKNTINRAADSNGGRIVEAYFVARSHRAAQQSILALASHYSANSRVRFEFIDNTGFGKTKSSLDSLRKQIYRENDAQLEQRAMEVARRYLDTNANRDGFTEDLRRRVLRSPSQKK